MSWRRASIQSWFESPGSESLCRSSARKYARRRICSSVGSVAGLEAEDVDCFTADFFCANDFFFFAGLAATPDFFLGTAAFALPFEDCAAASSAGLLSSDVFGFLGTVIGR